MKYEYDFDYLTCQSCTAKIHCDDCAAQLQERLVQQGCISTASIDIPNHRICIVAEGMDEMDMLDMLEDAGIFAD